MTMKSLFLLVSYITFLCLLGSSTTDAYTIGQCVFGKRLVSSSFGSTSLSRRAAASVDTMPPRYEESEDIDRTETGNIIGLHGAESRFLSLSQLKRKEFWPRIIPVAGSYPGLTKADLLAPESQASTEPGQFSFDFTDPEGPQLGTVALPGCELVYDCIDPVVVVAENLALGIQLTEEVETLVLIDRGEVHFNPRHFYAFEAPDGAVVIRYFNEMPQEDGWQILGRVMYVTLPHIASTAKASGFLEEEEDD